MGWVSQLSGGFPAPLFLCPSIVQFLLAFCHSSWVVGGWIVVLYAGAEPLQGDPVRLTNMSFNGGSYIIIHMQISLDLHPIEAEASLHEKDADIDQLLENERLEKAAAEAEAQAIQDLMNIHLDEAEEKEENHLAADETTEAFLTEAEVEAVKTITLQYIDQREAELLGCEVISFADTEPEAPTVTTQTFVDEVDTPTVHPLAEEEMFEVMDTEDHLDSDTEDLADEATEVVLTEAEVEEIKKFMLEYIDQREAELLAGNESHEDADVEVEAEDRNTLTDTQLDDTKATFSQTLGT
ncbi:hypothetical protein AOLI_G00102230 [Acnodon oligacanthus]